MNTLDVDTVRVLNEIASFEKNEVFRHYDRPSWLKIGVIMVCIVIVVYAISSAASVEEEDPIKDEEPFLSDDPRVKNYTKYRSKEAKRWREPVREKPHHHHYKTRPKSIELPQESYHASAGTRESFQKHAATREGGVAKVKRAWRSDERGLTQEQILRLLSHLPQERLNLPPVNGFQVDRRRTRSHETHSSWRRSRSYEKSHRRRRKHHHHSHHHDEKKPAAKRIAIYEINHLRNGSATAAPGLSLEQLVRPSKKPNKQFAALWHVFMESPHAVGGGAPLKRGFTAFIGGDNKVQHVVTHDGEPKRQDLQSVHENLKRLIAKHHLPKALDGEHIEAEHKLLAELLPPLPTKVVFVDKKTHDDKKPVRSGEGGHSEHPKLILQNANDVSAHVMPVDGRDASASENSHSVGVRIHKIANEAGHGGQVTVGTRERLTIEVTDQGGATHRFKGKASHKLLVDPNASHPPVVNVKPDTKMVLYRHHVGRKASSSSSEESSSDSSDERVLDSAAEPVVMHRGEIEHIADGLASMRTQEHRPLVVIDTTESESSVESEIAHHPAVMNPYNGMGQQHPYGFYPMMPPYAGYPGMYPTPYNPYQMMTPYQYAQMAANAAKMKKKHHKSKKRGGYAHGKLARVLAKMLQDSVETHLTVGAEDSRGQHHVTLHHPSKEESSSSSESFDPHSHSGESEEDSSDTSSLEFESSDSSSFTPDESKAARRQKVLKRDMGPKGTEPPPAKTTNETKISYKQPSDDPDSATADEPQKRSIDPADYANERSDIQRTSSYVESLAESLVEQVELDEKSRLYGSKLDEIDTIEVVSDENHDDDDEEQYSISWERVDGDASNAFV